MNIAKHDKQEDGLTKIESLRLFRVEISQILANSLSGPIEQDFSAEVNFRAVIDFNINQDALTPEESNYCSWVLSNKYAEKGTLKGFFTANVVLQGLNMIENKVLDTYVKKSDFHTLNSLLQYLAHKRTINREPISYFSDNRASISSSPNEKQMKKESTIGSIEDRVNNYHNDLYEERQKSWGLTSLSDESVELNQRYTYVLGRSKKKPLLFRMVIALKTRLAAGLDDVYAKHGTLVDTTHYDVEAAGEMTVLLDHVLLRGSKGIVISLDSDSGTYQPNIDNIKRAKSLLELVFENDLSMKSVAWRINVVSRPTILVHATIPESEKEEMKSSYLKYMADVYPQASEQREDIKKMRVRSVSRNIT